ncbi:hypothetical protein WP50_19460, partial [Lactiplantibacillus plantarum]
DRIRQHIYAGDIFQMIYANPCLGTMSGSLLAVYQQLQKTAAPYTCYFKQANFEMTVASPETLVTKDGLAATITHATGPSDLCASG